MKTKVCNKCNEEKAIDLFYKDKARRDGYKSACKKCTITYKIPSDSRTSRKLSKRYDDIPYKEGTLGWDVFDYFAKMNKWLSVKKLKSIVTELKEAHEQGTYWSKLDEIQERIGVGVEDYQDDLPKELMMDRLMNEKGLSRNEGPGVKAAVDQLTLEGEFVARHESISDASLAVTGSRISAAGGISHCAKGYYRQSFGYIWQYSPKY